MHLHLHICTFWVKVQVVGKECIPQQVKLHLWEVQVVCTCTSPTGEVLEGVGEGSPVPSPAPPQQVKLHLVKVQVVFTCTFPRR